MYACLSCFFSFPHIEWGEIKSRPGWGWYYSIVFFSVIRNIDHRKKRTANYSLALHKLSAVQRTYRGQNVLAESVHTNHWFEQYYRGDRENNVHIVSMMWYLHWLYRSELTSQQHVVLPRDLFNDRKRLLLNVSYYTGMWHPNGSFFHKKSLDMGPLFKGKTLRHGPYFQNVQNCVCLPSKISKIGLYISRKILRNGYFFWQKWPLEKGKGFEAAHPRPNQIRVVPPPPGPGWNSLCSLYTL